MKILHSTIKKKWFDMILSGEKLEEYKDMKMFWAQRLIEKEYLRETWEDFVLLNRNKLSDAWEGIAKEYDAVQYYNGWACSTKYPNFTIEFKGFIELEETMKICYPKSQ